LVFSNPGARKNKTPRHLTKRVSSITIETTTPKGNKMNYEFLFTMWECIGCRLLYNDEQDKCTNCKNKCEPIKIKGVRA
jgi:hypothetical protein